MYAIPSVNEGSRDLARWGRRKWMLNQNCVTTLKNASGVTERRRRRCGLPSSKGSEQQHRLIEIFWSEKCNFLTMGFPSLHLSLVFTPFFPPPAFRRPFECMYDALISRFLPTSFYLFFVTSPFIVVDVVVVLGAPRIGCRPGPVALFVSSAILAREGERGPRSLGKFPLPPPLLTALPPSYLPYRVDSSHPNASPPLHPLQFILSLLLPCLPALHKLHEGPPACAHVAAAVILPRVFVAVCDIS